MHLYTLRLIFCFFLAIEFSKALEARKGFLARLGSRSIQFQDS